MTRQIRFIWKPLTLLLCLVPMMLIIGRIYGVGGTLGSNPIEALQDHFGEWGLRFILITLCVTPLRKISGLNWLLRFRRMLGLFAFFYILMHFLVWMVLDQDLLHSASALDTIVDDILERPFITIGMVALLLLIALAMTSTNRMRRWLGRSWQKLHNSIYLIAVLGVWHFWWQVKNDISEPLVYALILSVLLGYRIWDKRKTSRA